MKKAFTLIEVNLAIMVMAVGVLGIISLYAFGFREERQSREDVASAAYADAVMAPRAKTSSTALRRPTFAPNTALNVSSNSLYSNPCLRKHILRMFSSTVSDGRISSR